MQRKWLVPILLVAYPLNLLWENLHAFLYVEFRKSMQSPFLSLCALADALITLFIYILVGLLLRDSGWVGTLNRRKIILALSVSVLSAVVLEKLPLSWSWWSYSSYMPVLPWVQIGLSPFLQISLLPLTTFLLVSLFSRTGKKM